ncbi:unnamed protein product, partial [Mycena citricolor]
KAAVVCLSSVRVWSRSCSSPSPVNPMTDGDPECILPRGRYLRDFCRGWTESCNGGRLARRRPLYIAPASR